MMMIIIIIIINTIIFCKPTVAAYITLLLC